MFRIFSTIASNTLQYSLLHRCLKVFPTFTISLRRFVSSPLIHQLDNTHESLLDGNFMNGSNTVYLEDLYSQWLNDPSSVHQVGIRLYFLNTVLCGVLYEGFSSVTNWVSTCFLFFLTN